MQHIHFLCDLTSVSIFSFDQPLLVYPQYQLLPSRQDGGGGGGQGGSGGGFWQTFQSYFCGDMVDAPVRARIPPNIDMKLTEKEAEIDGSTEQKVEADKVTKEPSKPYYFVLPPNQLPSYYYYPSTQFVQPSIFPKLIGTNARANEFSQFINANAIQQPIHGVKDEVKSNDLIDKEKTTN